MRGRNRTLEKPRGRGTEAGVSSAPTKGLGYQEYLMQISPNEPSTAGRHTGCSISSRSSISSKTMSEGFTRFPPLSPWNARFGWRLTDMRITRQSIVRRNGINEPG